MPSPLELKLALALKAFGADLPAPEREYTGIPGRKFRFDFAFPDKKIAIEIQGGLYAKGGHNSVGGINRDCEKLNRATLAGWRCLLFTEKMLTNDPAACVDLIRQLLHPSADTTKPHAERREALTFG